MTKRTRDPARQGTGGVTAGAALQPFLDAGSAAGGVLHDSYGLGSALIVAIVIAALGALTCSAVAGRPSALPGQVP
jgi:predicted MFS family arabinose efflux permease